MLRICYKGVAIPCTRSSLEYIERRGVSEEEERIVLAVYCIETQNTKSHVHMNEIWVIPYQVNTKKMMTISSKYLLG